MEPMLSDELLRRYLLDYLARDTSGRRFHRPWPLGGGKEGP